MTRQNGFFERALPVLSTLTAALLIGSLAACDLYQYGKLGGADQTGGSRPGDPGFEERMDFLSGVWYSRCAGIGRLDGYRIGKWGYGDTEFRGLMQNSGKISLFPDFDTGPNGYDTVTGASAVLDQDYFVFYDDTVYGAADDHSSGNGGFDDISAAGPVMLASSGGSIFSMVTGTGARSSSST